MHDTHQQGHNRTQAQAAKHCLRSHLPPPVHRQRTYLWKGWECHPDVSQPFPPRKGNAVHIQPSSCQANLEKGTPESTVAFTSWGSGNSLGFGDWVGKPHLRALSHTLVALILQMELNTHTHTQNPAASDNQRHLEGFVCNMISSIPRSSPARLVGQASI